jgi:SAM-dependent methyltransferase
VTSRRRALAMISGVAVGALLAARHHGAARGRIVPGGILMGNVGAYDTMSRLILGSRFRSIAADVVAVSPLGARALEVGCGPGHLSILLAKNDGFDVTGLDLDPAMIERARANAERVGPDERLPSFVVGDVAALPFSARSFDVVVSTFSMHHWSDPPAGLAEIGRVLRPGGRAFIWDFRPGAVPLHRHMTDPIAHLDGSSLLVVDVRPWRWPWRFTLSRRIELAPAHAEAA